MSMALPVIERLLEIVRYGTAILSYEAMAGCVLWISEKAHYGRG